MKRHDERPILMNASMVLATLDDSKTQTRRMLKTQPLDVLPCKGDWDGTRWVGHMQKDPPRGTIFRCSYGKPGDRLWVRETFGATDLTLDDHHRPGIHYRATDKWPQRGPWPWRPSIHMPRWASRLTLEITEVRVERLQTISAWDAVAEGMEATVDPQSSIDDYRALWGSINGPGSWAKNPWVWVISFKRIK